MLTRKLNQNQIIDLLNLLFQKILMAGSSEISSLNSEQQSEDSENAEESSEHSSGEQFDDIQAPESVSRQIRQINIKKKKKKKKKKKRIIRAQEEEGTVEHERVRDGNQPHNSAPNRRRIQTLAATSQYDAEEQHERIERVQAPLRTQQNHAQVYIEDPITGHFSRINNTKANIAAVKRRGREGTTGGFGIRGSGDEEYDEEGDLTESELAEKDGREFVEVLN
ncbi:MAG: hypothetical protein EZS28_014038 [Streblomastix strix]|uniref:Uncharacterized protein n=1 Tax=Streblomastix strix TaxID=222440 RepID=A0A5J4W7B4_9EUKA|nr:MAG: hypothetical protein EZS28_014038 [Streblomastix strix]